MVEFDHRLRRGIAAAILSFSALACSADDENALVFELQLSASTGQAFGVESPSTFHGTVSVDAKDLEQGRSAPIRDFSLTVGSSTWTAADHADSAKVHFPEGTLPTLGLSVRNADGHQLVITGDSQWLAQAADSEHFLLGYVGTVQVRLLEASY